MWRILGAALVVVSVLFALTTAAAGYAHDRVGSDFEGTLWEPGRAILRGDNPYPDPDDRVELERAFATGVPAVYPAPMLVAAAPLALLPRLPAATLFGLLSTLALVAGLWLVGLRDWRCYGLVLGSKLAQANFEMGQLSGLLVLACAGAWRLRGSAAAGLPVAAGVAAKLLVWPLAVWLFATRRTAAAVTAVAGAAALAVAGWSTIRFAGLGDYPQLVAENAERFSTGGHSLAAAGQTLGLSAGPARLLPVVALALLLAGVFVYAGRPRGDLAAFTLAIAAATLGSPVAWQHYYLMLLVPLAIARPRFAPVWLVPLVFWIETPADPVVGVAAAAVIAAAALRPEYRRRAGAPSAVPA